MIVILKIKSFSLFCTRFRTRYVQPVKQVVVFDNVRTTAATDEGCSEDRFWETVAALEDVESVQPWAQPILQIKMKPDLGPIDFFDPKVRDYFRCHGFESSIVRLNVGDCYVIPAGMPHFFYTYPNVRHVAIGYNWFLKPISVAPHRFEADTVLNFAELQRAAGKTAVIDSIRAVINEYPDYFEENTDSHNAMVAVEALLTVNKFVSESVAAESYAAADRGETVKESLEQVNHAALCNLRRHLENCIDRMERKRNMENQWSQTVTYSHPPVIEQLRVNLTQYVRNSFKLKRKRNADDDQPE